jgi:eukaryotic-like serine/threonine-protein kinase
MSFQIGDVVDGKYKILERLGAGGMGEVYKSEHVFLRAIRVVKVIRPQISESADAHERFLREAQLATKVQHPNVATLHDFSALPDGSHYMVWEYIEGENLAQVMRRRGTLPVDEAINLTVQALAGLDAIHRAGIIHRDISPENLMITPSGTVKIIDLGVAKAEQGDHSVTQTGMFVGKLRYASSEQLGFLPKGEKLDSRADLYSLGVVLFEMLAGRPPFEATSPHQYFIQHSGGTNVQPIDLTVLPNEMRPVMAKALASDRSQRFANASEFSTALQNIPKVAAAETIRTLPPETIRNASPTVRTAVKKSPVAPPPARSRDTQNVIIILVVIVLLALGAVATWMYRSRGTTKVAETQPVVTTTTAAPATQPQPQATTTVDVAPPQPAPASVPAPAVVQPEPQPQPQPQPKPQPKPQPAVPPAPQPEPKPQPQPKPKPAAEEAAVTPYIEGTGNDAAVVYAQQQLKGVTHVTVESNEPRLFKLVHDMNLTISDDAKVKIKLDGKVDHLRFGRKTRQGYGTITKDGKIVFIYELKFEEYRVGDTPAEAFGRVLSDIFGK